MTFARLLLAGALAAAPAAAFAQTVVPVPHFDSVQLREGGHVVVKYGAEQRVTLLSGSTQYTSFTQDPGDPGQLVIDTCSGAVRCPSNYKLEVEIVTPGLSGAAVDEGGEIDAASGFPAQDRLSAAVNEGGIVDTRAIQAANVSAAVNQGGQVKVTAQSRLRAAVNQGGEVIYWGDPDVSQAINEGGDVHKGG